MTQHWLFEKKARHYARLASLLIAINLAQAIQIAPLRLPIAQNEKCHFTLKITPEANDFVYLDSIHLTSDNPAIALDSWRIEEPPQDFFDPTFNTTKKGYRKHFTITGTLLVKKFSGESALVLGYFTHGSKTPTFARILLVPRQAENPTKKQVVIETDDNKCQMITIEDHGQCPAPHEQKATLNLYLQGLFARHTSWGIRLLLALLLGILMSLTPCIYPMIPITVGILHAHRHQSLIYNFLLAFSYMAGIACTFAALGLGAAFTGIVFGSLTGKPIVIISIVAILAYFALSLFGLYQLKLPSFLTKQRSTKPTGSVISAFLFGVASGTIASPCLSPGLAFLLTIVASMGSKILGFALLFSFGVGMSIPLLIIGTFSTTINILPRAGAWMLETQKIFGLLLIALCFYYLSNILPLNILLWLMATSALVFGFYYAISAPSQTRFTKYFKYLVGLTLIAGSLIVYWQAITLSFYATQQHDLITWQKDFKTAHREANNQNKLLFIDVGASYCSICKAIDRCVLQNPAIACLLNRMVCVKIDAGRAPEYEHLRQTFNITGVPTLLIIDPKKDTPLQRWGAELYDMRKNEIIERLTALLAYQPLYAH